MRGDQFLFWLGASADADRAAHEPSQSALSRPSGEHPSRWHFRQYGYEKFSIFDERGAEIGFVHRRRDAERIATEWTA